MNSRKLLALIIAAVAVLAFACGTDGPASSPTAEATPTAVPIELINADPSEDADSFKASLSTSEAECYESAIAEVAEVEGEWELLGDMPEGMFTMPGEIMALQGVECYSDETLQRLYIGQVDRLAGGLSNATLNCMVEHTANTNFSGLFSSEQEALEPDNLMTLLQSIFCLDDGERLAFETSLAAEEEDFRVGMIDGLECTVDYQDGDGNFVVQNAISVVSLLSGNDPVDEATGEIRPEVREGIGAIFDVVPVAVECGLVTDEDLADSGLTAEQLVCASDSLREPLMTLMDTMSANPETEMDFGTLAALFTALDECDINLEDIEGMESLFGAGLGSEMEFGGSLPEVEAGSSTEDFSIEDLEQFLTAEQISCLFANISPEEMQQMMESGEPPVSMFALLGTCNITLDQFIEGF